MPIFDTHAHYDSGSFNADRDAVLSALPAAGVTLVVNPGCELPSSREAVALAERYPHVYAAVGVHPSDCAGFGDAELAALRELCRHEKVVAVGEAGLDYHWPVPKDAQLAMFEQHIKMALELQLPLIVHDREAHADTYALLAKYRPKGVVHCYSGSAEDALTLVKQGMYIGFTGACTFKGAKRAAKAIAAIPLEHLLLETDCPYMAPEPLRGRRSDSSMIVYTAAKIAEIKEISTQEVLQATAENARRLFQIQK